MEQSKESMVYADATETRFFLIPKEVTLPSGDFVLGALTGQKFHVSAEAAAKYEIPEAEAQAHVQAYMDRIQGVLDQVKSTQT